MAVKVFILGRPGSGKSVASRRIAKLMQHKGWSAIRITDYDILHDMFQREKFQSNGGEKKFRPTDYDGFDVVDFSVLNTALEEVEKKARKHIELVMSTPKIIFIEFARDDYQKALGLFSDEFLQDAYFLFLDADIQTCIARIHKRVTIPPTVDNHFVSDEIIKNYYYRDNKPYMSLHLSTDYNLVNTRIRNIENIGSWESYLEQINKFADTILQNEQTTRRSTGPLQNTPSLSLVLTAPGGCK